MVKFKEFGPWDWIIFAFAVFTLMLFLGFGFWWLPYMAKDVNHSLIQFLQVVSVLIGFAYAGALWWGIQKNPDRKRQSQDKP